MAGKWRAAAGGLTAALAATMLVPLAAAPAPAAGTGSVSLTAVGVAASENFDSLAIAGTANTALPGGWYLRETGTSTPNDAYGAGTGSDTAGDVYSFGAAAATERAFGGAAVRVAHRRPSVRPSPTTPVSDPHPARHRLHRRAVAARGTGQRRDAASRTRPPRLRVQPRRHEPGDRLVDRRRQPRLHQPDRRPRHRSARRQRRRQPHRGLGGRQRRRRSRPEPRSGCAGSTSTSASSDDGLAVDDFSITPRVAEVAPIRLRHQPCGRGCGRRLGCATSPSPSPSRSTSPTRGSPSSCEKSGTHAAAVHRRARPGSPSTPRTNFDVRRDLHRHRSGQPGHRPGHRRPAGRHGGRARSSRSPRSTPRCAATRARVHDVQGNGARDPARRTTCCTIQAVVVGDYQGPGQFGGYYVQEEDVDADADPNTSEGIFVANTSFAGQRRRRRAGQRAGWPSPYGQTPPLRA